MSESNLPELVVQKLESLPVSPGCYLFRGREGEVLYVGKAKSLRARVRSYFQVGGSDERAFIPQLPRLVGDIETFVTLTEKEAAILENNLIKEHRPRLNVKLRDDKEYLTLRLDAKAKWPRLELVRRPDPDGARYFGPYHSATAARRTLHLIEKHFKLRTCTDRELKSRKRPCIQYQIQRCPAPCVLEVDEAEYGQQVESVRLFLAGRHDALSEQLETNMKRAAREMAFEVAAIYRDQIDAVAKLREEQRVVLVTDIDQDVLGLYREGDLVELSMVCVRQGRVVEIVNLSHARTTLPDDEIVSAFLREHYGVYGLGGSLIPDEVILPVLPDGADGVEEWLAERREEVRKLQGEGGGKKPSLVLPRRGPRVGLLDLARENAAHAFHEKRRKNDDQEARLREVQEKLRLPALPRRIECCDISHFGGEATVGSVVALTDGEPDKKRYKAYRVRTVSDGDDYGAMYEVLSRRFLRGAAARLAKADGAARQGAAERSAEAPLDGEQLGEEAEQLGAGARAEAGGGAPPTIDRPGSSERAAEQPGDEGADADFWELPDLFVVDGGRGQLGVALAVREDLGLHDLSIVGLAKERETAAGEKMVDRVYLPGQKNPIALRPNTPELFMLARARDEAHRFANYQRERLGKKRRLTSRLDDVPGIGPATRKALLGAFGSLAALVAADDATLLAVKGMTKRRVDALRAVFGGPADVPKPEGSRVAQVDEASLE